jgi:hypothetical protein
VEGVLFSTSTAMREKSNQKSSGINLVISGNQTGQDFSQQDGKFIQRFL